ncbi:MAG: type II toxin-antitoxin system RelE/ParE family toxin [Bacteroidota bacterium]|nr:type II toxin-antitoxin system RelE/ParE family toxin [Bacteroidota bacterium]
MSYQLIIPKPVLKELNHLPSEIHDRIIESLRKLEYNPRPFGCLKLSGRNAWRIKVGDYRIIYEIDDTEQRVVLDTIGHRREIYRR